MLAHYWKGESSVMLPQQRLRLHQLDKECSDRHSDTVSACEEVLNRSFICDKPVLPGCTQERAGMHGAFLACWRKCLDTLWSMSRLAGLWITKALHNRITKLCYSAYRPPFYWWFQSSQCRRLHDLGECELEIGRFLYEIQ